MILRNGEVAPGAGFETVTLKGRIVLPILGAMVRNRVSTRTGTFAFDDFPPGQALRAAGNCPVPQSWSLGAVAAQIYGARIWRPSSSTQLQFNDRSYS